MSYRLGATAAPSDDAGDYWSGWHPFECPACLIEVARRQDRATARARRWVLPLLLVASLLIWAGVAAVVWVVYPW